MFSIKVVSESTGNPKQGCRVCVMATGLFSGTKGGDQYSDSNGICHFDSDPGGGEVYVDGTKVFTGEVSGQTVVYV